MRRFFQLGLLAVVPVVSWSQIALVNVTPCGSMALPGGTCTIPSTSSGHLLVVGLQLGGGVSTAITFSSLTDNAGNVYSEAGLARSIDSAAGAVVDIWYAKNSMAGATTVTITSSASVSGVGVVIWEFSGIDPASPLDQTAVLNSQVSTATPTGAPVLTTSSSEVVISLAAVAGNVTGISVGNAFTSDATLKGNGWAHLIAASTGSYSAMWTESPAGTYASSTASFKAATSGTPSSACDLAAPYGTVNAADVQAIVNMTLGITPCTANIGGAGVCNAAVVQRVINAALPGGTCVTGMGAVPHYVTLNWSASTTPNVTYNVYRSTTSGVYSPTPLASAGTATSYSDMTVTAGVIYYYVVTAVSGTSESVHSNETPATIPTP